MPAKRATIVGPIKTEGGLGPIAGGSTANIPLLEQSFPQSPIYTELVTDDERINYYQTNVMHAEINDGGHTFGTFNTNFVANDPPTYSQIEVGGGGLPASPWVPNPVSAPNADPTQQPDPPSGFGEEPSDTPFMGLGSQEDPSKTTRKISDVKLGQYLMPNNTTPLYPGS